MQNFTKRELVLKIAKEQPNLTQAEIFSVIQKTLEHITHAVAKGQKIELRNFGVFDVVLRKPKPGRNPNNPTVTIPIPARAVVKFIPGKIMSERVLQLTDKLKTDSQPS